MGIRIQKVLGFALDDLEHTSERCDASFDSRLSDHPRRLLERLDVPGAYGSFLSWLTGREDEARAQDETGEEHLLAVMSRRALEEEPGWSPADSLHWDGEHGLAEVLLIRPPGHPEWARSDDALDYYTHAVHYENASPRLERLNMGIYPYSGGGWVDARTGTRLRDVNSILMEKVRSGQSLRPEWLSRYGFESGEDVLTFMRPEVPPVVRHFCEWAAVFREPRTAYSLWPTLYTYWS